MRLLPQSNPSPREGATAEITTMSPASSFAMSFLSWSPSAVAPLIFSQKIASHSASRPSLGPEQHLETLLAPRPERCYGGVFSTPGRD
jgi:hypothetical protein